MISSNITSLLLVHNPSCLRLYVPTIATDPVDSICAYVRHCYQHLAGRKEEEKKRRRRKKRKKKKTDYKGIEKSNEIKPAC